MSADVFKHDGSGRTRKALKKVHLKRNATDRFALCGVLPDNTFVLMAAMSHDSDEAVCQTCTRVATANLDSKGSLHYRTAPQDLVPGESTKEDVSL